MKPINTRIGRFLFVVVAMLISAGVPSYACIVSVETKLTDVTYADVVVVGRIENYRIIRDRAFRRRMLSAPHLTSEMRKFYRDPNTSLMSDVARFEIRVEELLRGRRSGKLSVSWQNSTFGLPSAMGSGSYLIALRRPNSPHPPLRGPSATVVANPDRQTLTVLQAPCAGAFILKAESRQAEVTRKILKTRRR